MDGAIRYLALAAKAGGIITGADECEKAVRRGKGKLLIVSQDAAPNTVRRAEAMAGARRLRLMRTQYTKSQLASALGRGSGVAIALVTNESLAGAFTAAAESTEQEDRI